MRRFGFYENAPPFFAGANATGLTIVMVSSVPSVFTVHAEVTRGHAGSARGREARNVFRPAGSSRRSDRRNCIGVTRACAFPLRRDEFTQIRRP